MHHKTPAILMTVRMPRGTSQCASPDGACPRALLEAIAIGCCHRMSICNVLLRQPIWLLMLICNTNHSQNNMLSLQLTIKQQANCVICTTQKSPSTQLIDASIALLKSRTSLLDLKSLDIFKYIQLPLKTPKRNCIQLFCSADTVYLLNETLYKQMTQCINE